MHDPGELLDDVAMAVMDLSPESPETFDNLIELFRQFRDLCDDLNQHDEVAVAGLAIEVVSAHRAEGGEFAILRVTLTKFISVLHQVVIEEHPLRDLNLPEEVAPALARSMPAGLEADLTEEKEALAEAASREQRVGSAQEGDDILRYSTLDIEMVELFLSEADTHLENAERTLLALEGDPSNRDELDAAFRAFHSLKGNAGFASLKAICEVAHEAESILDLIRSGEAVLTPACGDLLLRSIDCLRSHVQTASIAIHMRESVAWPDGRQEMIDELHAMALAPPQAGDLPPVAEPVEVDTPAPLTDPAPVAEVTPETLSADADSVEDTLTEAEIEQLFREARQQATLAPALPEPPAPADPAVTEAPAVTVTPAVTEAPKPTASRPVSGAPASLVKVDQQRLDRLTDLVGELVIAESMVECQIESGADENSVDFQRAVHQLRKITRELQSLSLSLRMHPVGGVFQRMSRLVRDLSRDLGKPVVCETEGAETELDKTLLDAVVDPLTHIVRNSLDHGIEPPEDRAAAGKSPEACVRIAAFHQGGMIHIEVEDDGRGFDRERLLAKAVAAGIVAEGETLTNAEIDELIFHSGLSTAGAVTNLSGRGVGMDVVRRNVEALRGHVTVRSEPGQGTCVRLSLPLTLAIIDGMVVKAGGEDCVLPTLNIVEQLRWSEDLIERLPGGRCVMRFRDRHVPVGNLADTLAGREGATSACSEDSVIVLMETGESCIGVVVDSVAGQQQVVIKPLGVLLERHPGLLGGAILPNGNVGLVLDPVFLGDELTRVAVSN